MNLLIIGIIAIVAAIFISRALAERSHALLSFEQKESLSELLAPMRKLIMTIMAVAIVALILTYKFFKEHSQVSSIAIVSVMVVVFFIISTLNYKKTKQLDMPAEYIKLNTMSVIVRVAGFIIFMICYVAHYLIHGNIGLSF